MINFGAVYTGWIEDCKRKCWNNLETNIEYPCVHIDAKILARATFDAYHPEKNNELSAFTVRLLETNFVPGSTLYGLVHLGDFASAYLLATDEVQDVRIAAKISDYVKKHANTLGLMLASKDVDPWLKTRCVICFPFLSKYRKDIVEPANPDFSEASSSDLSSSGEAGIDPALFDLPIPKQEVKLHFPVIPVIPADEDQLDASSDSSTVKINGIGENDDE